MAQNVVDPSKKLSAAHLERVAQLIVESPEPVSAMDLARLQGVTEVTALKRLRNPQVIDRATFLMKYRLRGAIPKALSTLETLLDSKHDSVRLKAATELLDRAGLRVEKDATSPAFTIELNLGDGLKTATSQRPPHQREEFLGSEKPPLNHEEFLGQVQPGGEGSGPEEDSESANKH